MTHEQIRALFGGRSPEEIKKNITPESARQLLDLMAANPKRVPRFIRRRAQKELTKIAFGK